MAFGDKLFRKNTGNENNVAENLTVQSDNDILVEAGRQDLELNEDIETIEQSEEEYEFQFALTDENVRKRVIEFIKPIKDKRDVINLQLAYGVVEAKTNIFIVRTSSTQMKDDDTGEHYDTTYFVALTDYDCIPISYTVTGVKDEGEAIYHVPKERSEILTQALKFWRNWKEHKNFQKEYDAQHDKSMLALISALNAPLYKLIPEKEPVVKQHFTINSMKDAKTLFYLRDTDCYRKMTEQYDDATVEAFKQYVDEEQKVKWIVEECEEILSKIIEGDTEKLYKKLGSISGKCEYWLSDPNDLAESYYKACQVIFSKDVYVPITCINSYLDKYTKRFNPLHAAPILDITEQYVKEKYPDEYEKGDYSGDVQSFKIICSEIRGKIVELSPAENKYHFKFVDTKQEMLETIVDWYQNKYNNVEAVKEVLAQLNCIYGIQNEAIFMTALNDEADSLHNQSFDRYEFILVNLTDREVIDFECKRNLQNGGFYIGRKSSGNLPEMALSAVDFFRNKFERDAFLEEYQRNHGGKGIYHLKEEARKALFDNLGSSFQELLNRISDNPLADTLRTFVELCEEKAPEWGYDDIWIGEPVSADIIKQWEQENKIQLPESYLHFLAFANGFEFSSASERIGGLDEIILSNDYIEPDYMIIGSMIGDGTTLCLSKLTGEAYIEDHGKYRCMGDFHELLDYVIEFSFG